MKKFLWCLLLVAVMFFPVSTNAFPLKTDVLNTEKTIIMYDDWDDDWRDDDRYEHDDWWDDDRYEHDDDDWRDDDRYEHDDDDDWDDDRWDD